MPIHLIWGDDYDASNSEIEKIVKKLIDPAWKSFNHSQIDGNDPKQAFRALEEIQSAPLGAGSRVVLVRRSPFCNGCPSDLAERLESCLGLLPEKNYLVLSNINKPDGRLRTTKAIQKLVKSKLAKEKKFVLPTIWDVSGQCDLVERIANNIGLKLSPEATNALVDAIGNDSSRITLELEKLSQSDLINLRRNKFENMGIFKS